MKLYTHSNIHNYIYTKIAQMGDYRLKPQEMKDNFIFLRAEGKSYQAIAAELHISKSTCTAWERELKNAIAERKAANLEELYNAYAMTREARIRKIGETLTAIDAALDKADLSQIDPAKLLDFKLKYTGGFTHEEYRSDT